jgi:superfamily I DNA/RNA helicase
MTKKIRIAGPPGTGKTTKLVEIYYDHLIDKYSPADIIVISHTNTAANHIRDKIYSDESIQDYQNKTGNEIFRLIKQSKETLKENVSTIHKFCKDRVLGDSFLIEDYQILINIHELFNKHTFGKDFQGVDLLFKKHPFFKFMSMARDNGKNFLDYYRSLTYKEKEEYKYEPEELIDLEKKYTAFKNNEKINDRSRSILDFQDMVEKFSDNEQTSEEVCADIKVLIVDEAQDSSVIQRKAERVMSKNVEYFYKAGDPDQSIFEFAGADPDSFHKEFARPEIELEQGHRCPRLVNEYCKDIIKPIWQHYNYSRVWRPREENGLIVEGEIFEMSDLAQGPFASELKNRILNTSEDFVFTYRGNEPTNMISYLKELGMPIKVPKNAKLKFKYPTAEINNHRAFLSLSRGENVSLAKIKSMLKSVDPQYLASDKNIEDEDRGSYDKKWLVENKYLVSGVMNTDDFQLINKINSIIEKNYIRKIVNNNRDLGDKRIFLENIHTIKGKEFDNVVLDMTLTNEEEDFVKRRMAFVACSRAKKTLWTLKSRTNITLHRRAYDA